MGKKRRIRWCVKGEDGREKPQVKFVILQELSYYKGIKDNILFLYNFGLVNDNVVYIWCYIILCFLKAHT